MSNSKLVRVRVDVEVRTTVECYINGAVGDDGVFRTDSASVGAAEPIMDVGHREIIWQLAEDTELGNEPLFVDEHGSSLEVDIDELEFGLTGDVIRFAPLLPLSAVGFVRATPPEGVTP